MKSTALDAIQNRFDNLTTAQREQAERLIVQLLDQIASGAHFDAELSPDVAAVLDLLQDPVIVCNPYGSITYTNRAFALLTGFERLTLLTTPLADRLHPDDAASLDSALRTLLAGSAVVVFENRCRTAQGEFVRLRWFATLVARHLMYCIGQAITGEDSDDHDTDALSHNLLRIIESAGEGIVIANLRGEIVLVNPYVEHVFGYSRHELVGKPVEILVPAALGSRHMQQREKYSQQPKTHAMGIGRDLMAQRKDGSTFPVEISLTPIEFSGEQMVLSFLVDITERKLLEAERLRLEAIQIELEKERELNMLKNRFVSMMSHEFRTPLTIIQSSLDILHRYGSRLSEEKQQDRMATIYTQIKRMTELLEDTLYFGKASAGKIVIERSAINLSAFCELLIENFRVTDDGEHQLTLVMDILPDEFMADLRMLEHILTNLVSNALKYSPAGAEVVLDVRGLASGVQFKVSDGGIGIPPEDQARIFEPFHRASNVGAVKGTGLGLAIAKHNVELHGGEIMVKSILNHGSTFIVTLPLNQPS